MTTELIVHCKTPIYSTYQYCPDCGDKLKVVPTISNAEQLQPEALTEIKKFYKNAKTFTGIVLETHLYRRAKSVNSGNYKNSINETFENAFNFITIEDEQGNTIQINIDGNGEAANKLQIGDAITIVEITDLTITMPAPSGISHMLNDRLADAFIVHRQDGSCYSKQNGSELFTPKEPSIAEALGAGFGTCIAVAFFAFLIIWIGPYIPQVNEIAPWLKAKEALKVGLIFSAFIGCLSFSRHLKRAKKHATIVDIYDKVIDSLLSVTFLQLGYHLRAPATADTDLFCPKCDTRCGSQLAHCSACGSAMQTKLSEPQTTEDSKDLNADSPNTIQPSSIKEKRLALMKQYQCETPEEKFEYNKFLGTTEHFTCSSEARVYHVLDRSLYAEKKSSSRTNYVYTETRNSMGSLLKTETDSSHTTITTKVDIEGKILVEDHDGNIEEMEVHPEILGTLDAGDYLFVAHQLIQHGNKESTNYRMIAYNITKNLRVLPYDIRDYQQESFLEKTIPYLFFPLAIYIGYHFDTINQAIYENFHYALPTFKYSLEHWALGILSLFTLFYLDTPITRSINKSNAKRAWKIVEPIFETYNKIKRDELGKKLAKYK